MPNYLDGTLSHARTLLGVHIKGHGGSKKFRDCVKAKLQDKHPGTREAARDALAAAAKGCK